MRFNSNITGSIQVLNGFLVNRRIYSNNPFITRTNRGFHAYTIRFFARCELLLTIHKHGMVNGYLGIIDKYDLAFSLIVLSYGIRFVDKFRRIIDSL